MLYLIIGIAVGLLSPQKASSCDPSSILKVDAVALLEGKELAGSEEFFVDHKRHRYLFSSLKSKEEFLRAPARYEVQLGGACARMGSLSGDGSTKLYAVHDGKLYLFASDACKKTFLSAPEKFLLTQDPEPTTDAESTRRGKEWLEKAVAAMGGANRIDTVKNYRMRKVTYSEYQGKQVPEGNEILIRFPDSIRKEYFWNESHFVYVQTPHAGWFVGPKENYELEKSQRETLDHLFLRRNLLSILKARNASTTKVAWVGSSERVMGTDRMQIEQIAVAWDGSTTTISIDSKTSLIVALGYRGPGPKLALGNVEHLLNDYRDVSGVLLPHASQIIFDGVAVDAAAQPVGKIEIDIKLDPDLFSPNPTPKGN